MYYLITDNSARFFPTREAAEEFQEAEYYLCTGDILPVPPGAEYYSVVDLRGMMRCLFYDAAAGEGEKIEVEP